MDLACSSLAFASDSADHLDPLLVGEEEVDEDEVVRSEEVYSSGANRGDDNDPARSRRIKLDHVVATDPSCGIREVVVVRLEVGDDRLSEMRGSITGNGLGEIAILRQAVEQYWHLRCPVGMDHHFSLVLDRLHWPRRQIEMIKFGTGHPISGRPFPEDVDKFGRFGG
jgi:hypothetical protein